MEELQNKLSHKELESALIKAIKALGGSATKKDVENKIYELLKEKFDDPWYQGESIPGIQRWKQQVAWARNRLRERGVIKNPEDSRRGRWEFAEFSQDKIGSKVKEDADAIFKRGLSYYKGVSQNYKEAAKCFSKAADQGHAFAQLNLGILFDKGKGVRKNDRAAAKWYRMAADQGHSEAQFLLASMLRFRFSMRDCEEAIKWYRMAADQGHAFAQLNLGIIFEIGDGVRKNYKEAVKWYRMAADQGDKHAQYNLGKCYECGRGVSKDCEEALKWYNKAAEQRYSEAPLALGRLYESGKGAPRDYEKALYWYRRVADPGNPGDEALKRLKSLERRLNIDDDD